MQLAAGTRLGRYRIESLLGAGGMGAVYRAHDSVLDRAVALKVLPPEVTTDAVRVHRFTREAKAASALTHPNILTIYDIGEATPESDDGRKGSDALHFISMELVAGETLRAALARKPDLETKLDWLTQIARGLAKAHEAGIVHRDLKPENVMIGPDGFVKILDFGLAKLLEPVPAGGDQASDAETAMRTEEGKILGTAGYMSPEQVEGRPTDPRSDIFSLGCVLYEAITGRRSFQGASKLDVLHQIVHGDPTPIGVLEPAVPEELQRIVRKCLVKDPDGRFQTAREVAIDLHALEKSTGSGAAFAGRADGRAAGIGSRAWLVVVAFAVILGALLVVTTPWKERPSRKLAVSAATPTTSSVAVLPLANLSGDETQDYFAAGLTDALTNGLGRLGALRVISRQSASRFKGTDKPLPEIAAALGVDFILEGSVFRGGDRVRVTVDLVRAENDSTVWSESYEHDLADVLSVQSEVSTAVARNVGVVLTPGEMSMVSRRRTVDPATFEIYLRGMHAMRTGTPDGFQKGMSLLHDAIETSPEDSLAYAGLATGYVAMGHDTGNPDAFRQAKVAARRALELDDTSAEAQGAIAEVELYYEWDWQASEGAFQRAIELNPNHPETHAHYAALHMLRGQWDDAIAQMSTAQRLDPFAPIFSAWMAEVFWGVGRYDEGIEAAQRGLGLYPEFPLARMFLALSYQGKGRTEEAIEAARLASEKAVAFKPLYGRVLLEAGRRDEARALLDELTGNPDYAVNPLVLANFQAAFGDVDGAIASLERAIETRNALTPWAGSWFDWHHLADEPRYQEILERLKLEYIPPPAPANVPVSAEI